MKHPIQYPVMVGEVLRFTENKVVSLMLDMLNESGKNINDINLAVQEKNIPIEDLYQFYQLIGYSVSGCPIPDRICEAAYGMDEYNVSEYQARAELAEEELDRLKADFCAPMARLFNMSEDDFK